MRMKVELTRYILRTDHIINLLTFEKKMEWIVSNDFE